jgi:cobalt-zinc-cadmium efflux system membrane fusion protein
MHRLSFIISFCMLSLFLFSCSAKNADTKDHKEDTASHVETPTSVILTQEQYQTAGIQTSHIIYKTLTGIIKVNGLMDAPPQQVVSVSPPLSGFLKATEILQGRHVAKGELIAVMQDPSYIQMQQDYLDDNSQLEYLKAEYERQQDLSKENINAKKTLQQAKANYQSMVAKVNGLKAKLKLLNINLIELDKGNIASTINLYSPVDGYVTEMNVNIGKYVNSTDVMFEIVDTRHLHVELTVFEKDVPYISMGQKVRFVLANETKERTATVYLVGREISNDRTIRIHCHLDTEDKSLLPGMYLTAYVETKNAQQPALPDEAVLNYEGKKYIFVEEHFKAPDSTHHYKMEEVSTSVSEGGFTAVNFPQGLDTLHAIIVTKGAYDLLSKLKNSGEEEGE